MGRRTPRLHVSAGIGTSPFAPVRFCCRPEATLLTLIADPHGWPGFDEQPGTLAANNVGALTRDPHRGPQPLAELDRQCDPADRGGCPSQRRHPSAALPAAGGLGRRTPASQLYLKDETTHITGSLKHRLARSLFLYALCNGWIGEGTTVVEASSGSTAVSEAYFAALLGLPFVAVMPAATSAGQDRADRITRRPLPFRAELERGVRRGGSASPRRPAATIWTSSPTPSAPPTGAATTTSPSRSSCRWRDETHPIPAWIVVGAGTGGTSATIGRYIRYRRHATRLCVVDPENSAFFPAYAEDRDDVVMPARRRGSRASAGRGSSRRFCPTSVDRMVAVPDAASIAAARHVSAVLGRRVGPSTGTNLWGAFGLLAEMVAAGPRRFGSDAARRQRRPLRRHLLQRRVGLRRRDSIPAVLPGHWSNSNAPAVGTEAPTCRLGSRLVRCDRLSRLQAGCGAAW